jgi:succinyl-diaminopimelate desuccinylase
MDFESISRKIESLLPNMIEWQKGLTAIPAVGPENGGEGELNKSRYLKSLLEALEPDTMLEINAPDERVPCGYRPNMAAIFKGAKSGPKVWVLSHMDVVPPGDLKLWNSNPFEAVVQNDLIVGRGVEDNQHGIVSSLAAVAAFKDLGVRPVHDIGLVFVADEEAGSRYGLSYVVRERGDLFSPDDLIIVPDGGNEEGTLIEISEKSALWMKFTVIGQQCHASTPEKGRNSLKAAAQLILDLDVLHKEFPRLDPLFSPSGSTFEPTQKEANVPNVNTIPGKDVFYMDCRVLPEYDLNLVRETILRICKDLEQRLGVRVETEAVQFAQAAPPTPPDAPVVKALQQAVRHVYGREAQPRGIGGGTVAAVFRNAGLPAAVWITSSESAHQPNEFVPLKNLVADARIFAHVFQYG